MEQMPRRPEPELMDDAAEALAYARADFADVNQAFVRRLIELAGTVESARALDLGTGPADIPIRVVCALPGWQVTAVEAARPMLGLARASIERAGLTSAIELHLADAKATGLPAGRSTSSSPTSSCTTSRRSTGSGWKSRGWAGPALSCFFATSRGPQARTTPVPSSKSTRAPSRRRCAKSTIARSSPPIRPTRSAHSFAGLACMSCG